MSSQYKYVRVSLASPEQILKWSHGEVVKHETINYRTLKPEPGGLFCEALFGPSKDYTCYCGKTKAKGPIKTVCPHCGVELTKSKVRRERLAHIKLATPVVHPWYLKCTQSPIALLLNLKKSEVEAIAYLLKYVVISVEEGIDDIKVYDLIDEFKYRELVLKYGSRVVIKTGAEAIKAMLQSLDLAKISKDLRQELTEATKQRREAIIRRLEVVEAFLNSKDIQKPEWMVLDVLPVIPPDLRPMVQLDGGRFATTDLNDLYRRILNRNHRLKRQLNAEAPDLIIKNEKRMLQDAVDSLIDNTKKVKKSTTTSKKALKSLSDLLRGKQGRFRQNLLGKRVDYSGRSVIVVGPNLKMYQCGLPREMALTLFRPYVIRELIKLDGMSIPAAKILCDKKDDRVWKILEKIVVEHPVLLNRAPTLHRLGIQAFEPVLIDGKAIRLHPLVCTAFNADFDGDQMAVHVPISIEAQSEARLLMLASNNILNPKDGKPVVTPSQDMVLGNYYLTLEKEDEHGEGHIFKDYDEAYIAYKNKNITLHTRIFVKMSSLSEKFDEGVDFKNKYILTTLGKIMFNNIIPNPFPYINEPLQKNLSQGLDKKFIFDFNELLGNIQTQEEAKARLKEILKSMPLVEPFKKKFLALVISEVFKRYHITETSAMLDRLKDLGFHYATRSGITISKSDVIDYKEKENIIRKSEEKVEKIEQAFDLGFMSVEEKKNEIKNLWKTAREEIENGVWNELSQDKDNAIFMMADSGSRGSASNFSQLAGMRGLMSNTAGETIEVPVKANFREGLSVSEFFISTHGSRKGSTDTALKTAQSGYLTRRLVDVSQDLIIVDDDCMTDKSTLVTDIYEDENSENKKVIMSVYDRILGRYLAVSIYDNENNLLIEKGTLLNEDHVSLLKEKNIKEVRIRTVLDCNSKKGICCKCYGRNLATNSLVEIGEAVGVVAAQSIGEPGTQLTMRTFHTGGVASSSDITQGLPRVEELFEARTPNVLSQIALADGRVKLDKKYSQLLSIDNIYENTDQYKLTSNVELYVKDEQDVQRGDVLSKGSVSLKELLRVKNPYEVSRYVISEIQKVYRSQGVEISDKHIEIIVRQMLNNLVVINQGGSRVLLPNQKISKEKFKEEVRNCLEQNVELPIAYPLVLGITKASLASDSFLSACSFQETTKILTSAAIRARQDDLLGLKENVIIGGLIPAGTGSIKEISYIEPARISQAEIQRDLLANQQTVEVSPSFDDSLDVKGSSFVDFMLDDDMFDM